MRASRLEAGLSRRTSIIGRYALGNLVPSTAGSASAFRIREPEWHRVMLAVNLAICCPL